MADDLRTRLLARMAELGLKTKSETAEVIGVSRSVFSYWVPKDASTEASYPATDNIPKVARFLDITEAEVMALYPTGYKMRAARSTAKDLAAMLQRQLDLEAQERQSNAVKLTNLNKLMHDVAAKIDDLAELLKGDD